MEKICVGSVACVAIVAFGALFLEVASPAPVEAKGASTHNSASEPVHRSGTRQDILKILGKRTKPVPTRLIIPSAGINSPIAPMGINTKGELDVPSGNTNDVGWWKGGPTPGEKGAAVLDAHVFAAFSSLKEVEPGDAIYVLMSDGSKRRFTAQASRTHSIERLSNNTLFEGDGTRELRLITCAGEKTADGSTYTKRLIVTARYASVS